MKKYLFFILFLLTFTSVQAQYTAIPDANFEAALAAYDDIPGDNQVPTANISGVTSLNVNNQNIADLSGIEDFTALQVLNCGSNQLTGLDVSQNTNLINLWCANNQLSSLDVSQNTALVTLSCANNQLNSLDVSQNTALVTLSCYGNQLSSLDVSQNTNLTSLACANNPLGNLDISQNTGLTFLWCSNNQLSSLDVSQHLNLTTLRCYNNQLSSLDVSQNTNLTALYCFSNPLGNLDLSQNTGLTTLQCQSNQLSSLDLSQNTNLNELYCQNNQLAGNLILSGLTVLTDFNATNNPNLLCVQVDNEVDANAGAGIYANWTIDGTTSYSESCIPYTTIPDANFEAALAAYDDIPGDNQVPTANISGVISLNVSNQNIADLSGIEDFTALQVLNCGSNQLSSLDVSQNTNLTDLDCGSNQLSSLDISQNINLTTLSCYNNQLTSLDVSQNTGLTTLWFSSNQLSSLDVSQNTNLTTLWFSDNQLVSLDISQNTNLTWLACFNNQLASLDVSQNINLTNLSCQNNQLNNLDVSQNTALTTLYCYNNQLTGNLILNGLHALTSFSATNNPNLLCVQVDNEADANAGTGIYTNWSIDGTASYSESCYTAIPDASFEAALNALGYDDIPGDNQVPTANISGITNLDVSNQNIADLTGIEDFTALQTLYCNSNQLTSLDLSQNTSLTTLWCFNNQLASLDLSQNTSLTFLWCTGNQLTSLDVSQNINLTDLACTSNQLTSLDVSQNTNLTVLWCGNNPLGSLDVSQNTNLTTLHCQNNQLGSLDVSQNTNLTNLRCQNNQLSSLDVSQNIALTDLRCGDNPLGSLDVSQNTNLTTLHCYNNQLSSLDVSQNTNLTTLHCYNNQLSSLDVSQNTNLTTLHCYNNQLAGNLVLNGLNSLTDFDATNNPNLLCIQVDNEADANAGAGIYTNWSIDGTASYANDCLNPYTAIPDANFEAALNALGYDDIPGDNQVPTPNIETITSLDVSNQNIADLSGIEDFTALEVLFCHNNQLTSLDLSQNTNLTDMLCVNNPNLSCIEVADVADANAGVGIYAGWHKDATAGYSENCGGIPKGVSVSTIKDDKGAIEEVPFVVGDIILYPNPVKDDLYIALPAERELVSVIVYNGRGERVAESKTTGVSLTNLAAGMYFVEIQTSAGKVYYKKILVSKQ